MQCVSSLSTSRVYFILFLVSLITNYSNISGSSLSSCGLRYARTKQKEDGHVPNRRRVIGASDIQSSSTTIAPPSQSPNIPMGGHDHPMSRKRSFMDVEDGRQFSGQRRKSPSSSLSPETSSNMIGSDDQSLSYQQAHGVSMMID